MDDQQDKQNVVEWSFSFEKLGDSINQQFRNMGIGDEPVKHEHFSAGLDGASSASIKLKLSVGRVTVQALANSDSLMEAEVAYTGEMVFDVSGEKDKTVRLSQKKVSGENGIASPIKDAVGKLVNRDDLRWDIGLSPIIPLSLDIDCGLGENHLDLSGLKLSKLKLTGGVGENHVTLPAAASPYSAKVKNGVGALRAVIAEGAALKLDVEGGVGSVRVELPAGAAVRIEAQAGLGSVNLPASLRRIKGGSDFISQNGVWETEGYALAAQQIAIRFKGGVGEFKAIMTGG